MKKVIVPQSDIDNIEKARELFHNLISSIEEGHIKPKDAHVYGVSITQPLYYLTHRRYRQTFFSRVKSLFGK